MADIFLSYAREDYTVAKKLYSMLSERWEVWWDDKIIERWDSEIEEEVPKSGCIVAVCSNNSRKKSAFKDELRLATKHGTQILLVRLDDSDLPYPYGSYSYSDLKDWSGDVNHDGFSQLQRRLMQVVPPKGKPRRPAAIGRGKVQLPTLFLSVSSHETQLVPLEALQALRIFEAPTILISAYDLDARRDPQRLIDELQEYHRNGGFILIDSGNYEASRLDARDWDVSHLEQVLSRVPHDWAFCFDLMEPARDPKVAVEEIVEAVRRDRLFTDAPVLPIIHAPNLDEGGYELTYLPEIVREVANQLEPELIAIPERELGPGLIARAQNLQAIRQELDKLPFYQPIHILGTGNPWSVAILAAAGADTFDGLEWCRMVVDRTKNRLHHFQHFDFFSYQTELADSSVARGALNDSDIDFGGKVAFHNLDYFSSYTSNLREAAIDGNMEALIVRLTTNDVADQLKRRIPGLFK